MNKKGFTLVEIMIVLAIFLTTGALFMPFSINNLNATRTDSTVSQVVSSISTAQKKGYTSYLGKAHAIRINTNSISYMYGDSIPSLAVDEEINFETGVSRKSITLSSGSNVIFFDKGNFNPTYTGEFVIGDDINEWKITINNEGMIDYYKL